MEEQELEKELPPSEQRQRHFRERGQVGRSRELAAAVVLLTGLLSLLWWAPHMAGQAMTLLREAIGVSWQLPPQRVLAVGLGRAAAMVCVPLALMMVSAVLAHLAQGELVFASKAIEPRWERLDPVSRFKQIFLSRRTLVELVKILLKVALVSLVVWGFVQLAMPTLLMLNRSSAENAGSLMGRLSWKLSLLGGLALLVLAGGDLAWQKWDNRRRMRMSPKELRDEMKEQEGDPLLRSRRRQRHRELARQQLAHEVPRADVVLTNPTELAVALRYDRQRWAAPRVTVKGSGELARRIRQLARSHHVPVIENKPLARWLFRRVKVGHPVPAAVYQAVAEIYAHLYRLKGRA